MPGSFHLGFGSSTDYNFPYWKSFEKFKSKYLGIYALLLLRLLALFFFFLMQEGIRILEIHLILLNY